MVVLVSINFQCTIQFNLISNYTTLKAGFGNRIFILIKIQLNGFFFLLRTALGDWCKDLALLTPSVVIRFCILVSGCYYYCDGSSYEPRFLATQILCLGRILLLVAFSVLVWFHANAGFFSILVRVRCSVRMFVIVRMNAFDSSIQLSWDLEGSSHSFLPIRLSRRCMIHTFLFVFLCLEFEGIFITFSEES